MAEARTILLVDDEPDLRRIGQLSLERVGHFRVLLAESGSQALALAQRERPDAILLDVMMPDMDGPTVLTRLRELPGLERVPVLFMTAKVQERERYLALGAAAVIGKPFDPLALPAEVRRAL